MKNPDTKQSQNQATTTKSNQETRQQNNKELLRHKTSVLIRARLRAHTSTTLISEIKGCILNTLVKLDGSFAIWNIHNGRHAFK